MSHECRYPFVCEETAYNKGCRCPSCMKHRRNKHLKYYYKRGGKKHDAEYKQKNKEQKLLFIFFVELNGSIKKIN